eukprot:3819571-Rhodomonas_salina.2
MRPGRCQEEGCPCSHSSSPASSAPSWLACTPTCRPPQSHSPPLAGVTLLSSPATSLDPRPSTPDFGPWTLDLRPSTSDLRLSIWQAHATRAGLVALASSESKAQGGGGQGRHLAAGRVLVSAASPAQEPLVLLHPRLARHEPLLSHLTPRQRFPS